MNALVCSQCGTNYPLDEPRWRCDCGGVLDIEFDGFFDPDRVRTRPPTMWRYREAIPIRDDANIVSLNEGFTPLVEIEFDGRPVLVKQEQLFSTGSFKDRGASVLVSKVKELGIERVVDDSSGNAGAAMAAYCARAGIGCDIFAPASTSAAKLAQIQLYEAALHRIPGSREDTASAALEAAKRHYYASHVWNPFFFHGTKTFAYEVCEQLGWRSPDVVVVPSGHGSLLLGLNIGFQELRKAGIVSRTPKLVAVQAANCAPLYAAFAAGSEAVPSITKRDTMAEGIAIAEPYRGAHILKAVRESGGAVLAVEESEIEESLRYVCSKGFYIEPTSAAAIAGLRRYLRDEKPDGVVVSVFTGHGLKATEKMLKLLG
jgi:threonine synthase